MQIGHELHHKMEFGHLVFLFLSFANCEQNLAVLDLLKFGPKPKDPRASKNSEKSF